MHRRECVIFQHITKGENVIDTVFFSVLETTMKHVLAWVLVGAKQHIP